MADKAAEAKVSRKEEARLLRREAYLRAKERRATDPKHLARMAAVKERRREAYRQAKERRQVKARADKATLQEKQVEKRAAADRELGKWVKSGAGPK